MPGIVGFIRTDGGSVGECSVQVMVDSLKHEKFYRAGTYLNESLGIAVGWAIHEGSFADCLPIWNDRRDICLIFSGEDYTEPAKIDELRRAGHEFESGGAAYLAHLYEEAGLEFLSHLNGCFSGVLLDLRERKIVLFNDRYGLGRIYFHETAGGFYFASEAKALLKVLPHLRELDSQSLAEALTCGCALQNRTIFSGIRLLPGASRWVFMDGREAKKESYFDRQSWENQPSLSAADYYDRMNETFTRVLPRYFRGDLGIGLSLTGGLDSRMIIAAASAQDESLPCYTFGGMYRECADVRLAKQIARLCGQSHTTIAVTKQFFSEFSELAEQSIYYTDGAMDVMGSVELFVNRTAREIAPVRMTGNYGSEILRKNVAFKPFALDSRMFDQEFGAQIKRAAETYKAERNGSTTSFIAFKQVPWHHYSRSAVECSQLTLRSPFLDNELVAVAYQAPQELAVNKTLAHRCIEENNPKLSGVPTDRGVMGGSRAASSRLGTFCQELMPRMEYMFDYGMPQWLARIDHVLAPLQIERLFLGRQKFYHFRRWYRDELAGYVKAVLLDKRSMERPYLNRRRVEEIVNAHTSGQENHTLEIHKLLTSELIQRQLIERN